MMGDGRGRKKERRCSAGLADFVFVACTAIDPIYMLTERGSRADGSLSLWEGADRTPPFCSLCL
jgi:hypothetical protein